MNEPTPLTQQIAEYAAGISAVRLSDKALQVVRPGFTDAAAVMLVGRGEVVTRICHRLVRGDPGRPRSRVCLSGERANPGQAAFVGAVSSH